MYGVVLILLGKGDAVGHQGLVLRFVIGITDQEAAAGELCDLLADQALFIEAVAEAFLRESWVERELAQHVFSIAPFWV